MKIQNGAIALQQSSNDWFWKLVPPVITAFVVFLITKLYDAAQYDKRFAALENKLVSKTEMREMFIEFESNRVTPLRDRISKSDAKMESIQHDMTEVKELVLRIAVKLEVQGK